MKRHRGTLNAYCEVKETSLKMLHTAHLELYGIKKDKTIKTVKKGVARDGEVEREEGWTRGTRDF